MALPAFFPVLFLRIFATSLLLLWASLLAQRPCNYVQNEPCAARCVTGISVLYCTSVLLSADTWLILSVNVTCTAHRS